jgi:vitamin B12 transporter
LKKSPSLALASGALMLLLSPASFAQTAGIAPMDQIVVTATRSEQKIADTILDTTVITEQDIRDSQAVDVPSLLRREAGFEFVQNGGIGSNSSTFLRGTNSTQVLVLIDGVRASSGTSGTTALDQIMLDQVERIEIVRGNVSSVYGSEAIGGVIQIFTKRGHGAPALSAIAGAGDRNTHRVTGTYSGEINDTRFNFTVSNFGTSGFPALNPNDSPTTNPNNDGYRNTSFSANLTQSFGPAARIGFTGYLTEGHLAYGDPFAASISDTYYANTRVGLVSVFGEYKVNDVWLSKLTLARGEDYGANFLNGGPNGLFQTYTDQVGWDNTFSFAPGQRLLTGLEHRRQEVTSTLDYTQTSRDVSSGFGGYTGEFGDHSVQANLRYERYSDFGSATTYLAGYGYRLNSAWRVSAAASSAFRAPNFNELYYPGFGSPGLQPERAQSTEIGVQYGSGAQLTKLVAFRTQVRDLIDGFPLANIDRAEITGAELSYRGEILGADVIASATAQNPVDESGGGDQQLLRRARRFAALTVQKTIGAWRLGGELRASSLRYDDNIVAYPTVVDTLAGYGVVNLMAHFQLSNTLALQARADNVFDRHYVLADGYNTQPRGCFISLNYQPR